MALHASKTEQALWAGIVTVTVVFSFHRHAKRKGPGRSYKVCKKLVKLPGLSAAAANSRFFREFCGLPGRAGRRGTVPRFVYAARHWLPQAPVRWARKGGDRFGGRGRSRGEPANTR